MKLLKKSSQTCKIYQKKKTTKMTLILLLCKKKKEEAKNRLFQGSFQYCIRITEERQKVSFTYNNNCYLTWNVFTVN